ncbi:nitrilase [Cupriavidus sp. YR651]|uniref:carbon-nitrogen hydrolase family protein n=1 Tax=Cupriavidus sp. YR651 TaxID=1855315 RepID=UPI00088EB6FB|nr:carbon-nitrogen hydrolase family protein [Cupriavidus sp. YR651]SDC83584.1 nitrilase [Cupriavidus sp. YR651]
MAKFVAAVVQSAPVPGDTAATVDKAAALIAEARQRGAEVALFPEAFIGGYPKGADFHIFIGARTPEGRQEYARYQRRAIRVPGPETDVLGQAARDASMYVVIGVIEQDGGTLYCTALYFGPDGALLGKHRKLMPTAAERLCWGFGDGSTLDVVDTPWGPLAAVICWENYMPLLRTAMYGKGVAIYCTPTADDRDSWVATARHIALEGRCFVLSACQYLTRANFPADMHNRLSDDGNAVLMRGGSMIIDPLGRVLAGPDYDGEVILTAELDTEEIARGQFDFDPVGHYARPDIFKLIVNESPTPAVIFSRRGAPGADA